MNRDKLMKYERELREKNTMETVTGRVISLVNPNPDDIVLNDVCQGLAFECRYAGQIPYFYSVAEHTMIVTQLAPDPLKPAAIVHDFSEAFIKDVISPLKSLLPDYKELERIWMRAICQRFNVHPEALEAVKEYDKAAFEMEYEFFYNSRHNRINQPKPKYECTYLGSDLSMKSVEFNFWNPYEAYNKFAVFLDYYFPERKYWHDGNTTKTEN